MPAVRKKAVAPPPVLPAEPPAPPPEPDVLRWAKAVIEIVAGSQPSEPTYRDLLAVGVRMGRHDRDLTLTILKHLRKGN